MNEPIEPLENALILSYLHSKLSIRNLEVAVHELSVMEDSFAGKLQHKFEKLINAHRNAMGALEKNIEKKELLEIAFDAQMDKNWEMLLNREAENCTE